ncbi:MAG TPA: phenylalanine--tRNA ligase subunit alpha [Patescibacteria group bacterium]|nr:phenylalanine--tRNA ligase subunit alpha [Patescibacteria group bacterium]
MTNEIISATNLISLLIQVQEEMLSRIKKGEDIEQLRLEFMGSKSDLARLTKQISLVPKEERAKIGPVVSEVKKSIEAALAAQSSVVNRQSSDKEWIDVTAPGTRPPEGHLHIVTQAIMEITRIFERIGFTRVRHPEVDWDYYAFESLNMPKDHPARDEWETFFIENSKHEARNPKQKKIVLTPHTSNGQVREMEKGKLPIRMINIAKCYRRQIDVSHTPMFHQFEGMYIDKGVSIAHLKGVFDYFVKQFYGPDRTIRLRPFHFQFTEPSFEVDINCGICLGKGCRLCKEGWLEMAGSGMVHPNVLRAGGVDPNIYSGFAFGWGVERAYMMKNNTKIDDIRLIYSNDIRFLQQF